MIQIYDLPHFDKEWNRWHGVPGFPASLCVDLGHMTAHTVTGDKHTCNCCKSQIETYVRKPGSPVVWCLRCF